MFTLNRQESVHASAQPVPENGNDYLLPIVGYRKQAPETGPCVISFTVLLTCTYCTDQSTIVTASDVMAAYRSVYCTVHHRAIS